jgi:hypothetical protein
MYAMKSFFRFFLPVLVSFVFVVSCKSKVKPMNDRVKKVWIARIVKENGAVVYSNGSSGNIKEAYASYRLDLSTPPAAILREVDGNSYTGTYKIEGNKKIIISDITPEPTGSGGKLEYTINSISEDNVELVLKLEGAYPKTGNTNNEYTLIAR